VFQQAGGSDDAARASLDLPVRPATNQEERCGVYAAGQEERRVVWYTSHAHRKVWCVGPFFYTTHGAESMVQKVVGCMVRQEQVLTSPSAPLPTKKNGTPHPPHIQPRRKAERPLWFYQVASLVRKLTVGQCRTPPEEWRVEGLAQTAGLTFLFINLFVYKFFVYTLLVEP